jgi:hypothetical protein
MLAVMVVVFSELPSCNKTHSLNIHHSLRLKELRNVSERPYLKAVIRESQVESEFNRSTLQTMPLNRLP